MELTLEEFNKYVLDYMKEKENLMMNLSNK